MSLFSQCSDEFLSFIVANLCLNDVTRLVGCGDDLLNTRLFKTCPLEIRHKFKHDDYVSNDIVASPDMPHTQCMDCPPVLSKFERLISYNVDSAVRSNDNGIRSMNPGSDMFGNRNKVCNTFIERLPSCLSSLHAVYNTTLNTQTQVDQLFAHFTSLHTLRNITFISTGMDNIKCVNFPPTLTRLQFKVTKNWTSDRARKEDECYLNGNAFKLPPYLTDLHCTDVREFIDFSVCSELRSLYIKSSQRKFVPSSFFWQTLPPTLTELFIDIMIPHEIIVPYLEFVRDISKQLPSLKNLALQIITYDHELNCRLMQALPRTLEELTCWKLFTDDNNAVSYINTDLILHMPQSLLRLNILCEYDDILEAVALSELPPGLLHLNVNVRNMIHGKHAIDDHDMSEDGNDHSSSDYEDEVTSIIDMGTAYLPVDEFGNLKLRPVGYEHEPAPIFSGLKPKNSTDSQAAAASSSSSVDNNNESVQNVHISLPPLLEYIALLPQSIYRSLQPVAIMYPPNVKQLYLHFYEDALRNTIDMSAIKDLHLLTIVFSESRKTVLPNFLLAPSIRKIDFTLNMKQAAQMMPMLSNISNLDTICLNFVHEVVSNENRKRRFLHRVRQRQEDNDNNVVQKSEEINQILSYLPSTVTNLSVHAWFDFTQFTMDDSTVGVICRACPNLAKFSMNMKHCSNMTINFTSLLPTTIEKVDVILFVPIDWHGIDLTRLVKLRKLYLTAPYTVGFPVDFTSKLPPLLKCLKCPPVPPQPLDITEQLKMRCTKFIVTYDMRDCSQHILL